VSAHAAAIAARLALAAASLALVACASSKAGHAGTDDDARDIESICREQQAAWNRGDVAAFMRAGYLDSNELTFFSGGEVTRGYDTVLARYERRYKSEGAEMGRLTFSELETERLGADHAILRGRWALDFQSRDDIGGLFTLVVRRTSDGWRIVHDHTSVNG
jgi:beta-aspartyl-peptidase (threonine type)